MSLISRWQEKLASNADSRWFSAKTRHVRRRNPMSELTAEALEVRQLLSATPIAGLSDEFDDPTTQANWQRVNVVEGWNADQLNVYDIDQTQAGRLVMQPHTAVWYGDWRGPMAFKEVTGDFVITSEIHISDRDDVGGSDGDNVPGDSQFSLAGVMIRTPRNITDPSADWMPGSMADDGTNNGENYVFLSYGYADSTNEFSMEVKSTRNSDSQLSLTAFGLMHDSITIQTARIGNSVITMYQFPGEAWQVHERYDRDDMPDTLQVGLVTYTDWEKSNDFDPFLHNGSVLTPGTIADPTPGVPFNPDLTAGFEYARFALPDVPPELLGLDLTDPSITDAQLLSFLGNNANIGPDGSVALPEVSVAAATDLTVEGDGQIAAFVVTRSGTTTDEPLAVNIAFTGSAVLETDFTTGTATVVIIPAGQASTTVYLTTLDDSDDELGESIQLQILGGADYLAGGESVASLLLRDDDTSMEVGVNLERHLDWSSAWVFKDAFLRARQWGALAYDPLTGSEGWQYLAGDGPALAVDEDGWISELPTWIGNGGVEYQQLAQTVIFTGAGNQPAGIYRAEWDGVGELEIPYVVESGMTPEGRQYALVDMPAGVHFAMIIRSTDAADPIRNINFWMPDYEGESLVGPDWQPGDASSPFHPLFLERLQGFETLRFMDWQMTNYNADIDEWHERSQLSDASFGDMLNATGYYEWQTDGVALEYMIELANELGVNAWFNMPYAANAEFVENFATMVRDNLNPDLTVYVEWSNELWNGVFPVNDWLFEQAGLPENAGRSIYEIAAEEIRGDFEIWSNVFAGQEDRIVRVVAGQQNNPWVLEQLLLHMNGEFDAVSSTAYAGYPDSFAAVADETLTADEIIDTLLDVSIPYASQLWAEHRALADQYSASLGRDIQYVTYESGSHIFGYATPFWGGPAQAAAEEALYSPRMYDVYQTLLNRARDIGVDVYNEFTFTDQYGGSQFGNYGLLHTMDQPLETAHQYNALLDFIATQQQAAEPDPVPQISLEVINGVATEAGTVAEVTFTRTDESLETPLTVNYSLGGTAEVGIDYSDPGTSIVIPAGESSMTLQLTPLDDTDAEGQESIRIELLDTDTYDFGETTWAEVIIEDDDFEPIVNPIFSHTVDVYLQELPAALPDETPLTYAVSLVTPQEYLLDQQYDFFTVGNFHQNYYGANEKWLQGPGSQWYYILPDGELRLWEGSFAMSSFIAQLDLSVYEDPLQLIDVELPATVGMVGNVLSIDAIPTFVGTFEIDVEMTDGVRTEVQRVLVEVTNFAPIIEPIADQFLPVSQDELVIPLAISDADDVVLQRTVRVSSDLHYDLDQQYNFYSGGDYHENYHGQNERWIQGNGGAAWFYILPNGELNQWGTSFEDSEFIAQLHPSVYENPMLLFNIAGPLLVNFSFVGDQLVVNPQPALPRSFEVELAVSDGVNTTYETFRVTIVNTAPVLPAIPDLVMGPADTEVVIPLELTDADGHAVSVEIEVIHPAYELDQRYGFYTNGNVYENHLGQQEKWIRDQRNNWFYLLESGDLYRWGGSFESSTLVESLGTHYYDNPDLLVDVEPLSVEFDYVIGSLMMSRSLELNEQFRLRFVFSDGIDQVSRIVNLSSQA